ncbi:sce7725 family protein [Anaerocolumna xylanovorans]|uniref:Sce7725 family protein n=1 Tax=Anaerocolumna xylanovorans DSM 12503 TaxID=1121345 RepID=A0A1M7Y8L4_9FIRM|nr:sce7725 family protein [Anaerocolumna xylanovorans]SHO48960.1 hypothetical protein SAMN02745217_02113 [Anaerocolumna xylanovorans DSM 12503]
MYLPYLRGKQYELIGLRELLAEGLLSEKIVPIIEPVKLTSMLIKTVGAYSDAKKQLILVNNPEVGNFTKEMKDEKNASLAQAFIKSVKENDQIIYAQLLNKKSDEEQIKKFIKKYDGKMVTISLDKDAVQKYEKFFEDKNTIFNLIPDESGVRRKIRKQRVMLDDKFKKLERNTDYEGIDEPFSEDHLYYAEDGYVGFADYSVVGAEYSDTGFAPYAVAIHIVYFAEDYSLRIIHFVSDSNDDITDPAGKFKEALEKLVLWNKKMQLKTKGIKEFEDLYRREAYPGLGIVKKLSIMHHLELIGEFLDRE